MAPLKYEYIHMMARLAVRPQPHPQLQYQLVVDPYTRCAMRCQYCWTHGDDAAPGVRRSVGIQTDLPFKLERLLAAAEEKPVLFIGAAMDPYGEQEDRFSLTRAVIEIALRHNAACVLMTKSDRILRDIELLERGAARGLVTVLVSVCGMDEDLVELWEPGHVSAARRLEVVRRLSCRGISTGVALMPLIPGVNDDQKNIKVACMRAVDAEADFLIPGVLSLDRARHPVQAARTRRLIEKRYPAAYARYAELYGDRALPDAAYQEALGERLGRMAARFQLHLHMPGATAPALALDGL